MTDLLTIHIDGNEVRAPAGTTILEAAEQSGVYIPRLCHRPGLAPHGACRVCAVRANGRPAAACTQPIEPGMVIESETDEIRAWRRAIIEMLFVEGNHYCMVCERSGACELQALAYRFGIAAPRYPFLWPKREVDATHPDVILDRNRCILCARCARTSREVDGKHVFGFVGRGADKQLAVDSAGALREAGLEPSDAAIDSCPVGAILRRADAYRTPIGARRYDSEPIGTIAHPKPAVPPGPGEML